MSKYEKLQLKELPKSQVVNSYESHTEDQEEDLITDAVTQHLSTIVGTPGAEDPLTVAHKTEAEVMVDIEQVKLENYNKGLDDARQEYESVISDLKSNENLRALILEKLSGITPVFNLDEEVIKLTVEMVTNIAKKIYLILPINFEQMLKEAMIGCLKGMYKEGDITIVVNPGRLDFCKEILKLEELPEKLKDKIKVQADENLNKDDCKLEWNDTRLEYNQEQLSFEINQILEQLRSAA